MNSEITQCARECPLSKPTLREFAAELPPDDSALDGLIEEVVENKDELAFIRILLSAFSANRRVDARHLVEGASLLFDLGHLAAAATHTCGEVHLALINAVANNKLDYEQKALCLFAAGRWCVKIANEPIPPELITRARILARMMRGNPYIEIPLIALAELVHDDGLTSMVKSRTTVKNPEKKVELFYSEMIDPVADNPLEYIADQAPPPGISGYTVRRAVPRIGRNDPCPCGSGKKYKKCCINRDQDRLKASSSIPGLTVDEVRAQREKFMSPEDIMDMSTYELTQLDFSKLDNDLINLLLQELNLRGELEITARFFEQNGVSEDLMEPWIELIEDSATAGKREIIHRVIDLPGTSEFDKERFSLIVRLMLNDDGNNTALKLLEETAMEELEKDDGCAANNLAYALLDGAYPALGIIVARGAIASTSFLDTDLLVEQILKTRDKLNLSPDDPFESILNWRFNESIAELKTSKELMEAQEQLAYKDREVDHLKSQLTQLSSEISNKEKELKRRDSVQVKQHESEAPAIDKTELHNLRHRIDTLKGELKDRHSERNLLRRNLRLALHDLDKLREQQEESVKPASPDPEQLEEDLLLPEESWTQQPVRIPEFPRKFIESHQDLPKHVIRHAIALIGRLASGDPSAFSGTKRIRSNRDILRQRVGAQHRLLFRAHSDTLEILDLINRRDLEKKIKSVAG